MNSERSAAEIRAQLEHPVIDVDGHLQELSCFLRDDVMDRARELGGRRLAERVAASALTYDDAPEGAWFSMTEQERRDAWVPVGAWWAMPTGARDRATSYLPALLHERMDELGIDFTVLYPSLGLSLVSIPDEEVRRVACRVYNEINAELYRPYSDRMTAVAIVPAVTPAEAIDELEHAVHDLRAKAIMLSHVRRPVPRVAREHPEAARLAQRLDTFGIDSDYDYDPLWQRCVDLGVAVGMHASEIAWGSRRSISRYAYNHVGCFAAAGESLCKSLFMGGVTKRFPALNFVFLEGGVAWGCSLLSDLVGHWEKRNRDAIRELDPAELDVARVAALFETYAPDRYRSRLDEVRQFFARTEPAPADVDDWRECGIETVDDFGPLFVERFFFGCEADDPMNAWAFATNVNPLGSRLGAVFGSDMGHWDVREIRDVLVEAHELVERGLIDDRDFRDFVFTNPVRLYAQANPRFFDGTPCEHAVAALQLDERAPV
jgi:predicted TIM-barrel fold metal-dependent hydrolase